MVEVEGGTVGSSRVVGIQLAVALSAFLAVAVEAPKVQTNIQVNASAVVLLADYVTWPKWREKEPLVIGVFGECPLVEALTTACRSRTIQGRKVRIVALDNPYSMDSCDVLFVCRGHAVKLDWALKGLKEKPILTLGEEPGLAKNGVMVNLVIENGKPVLEVNLSAIRRGGLMLSSRVLQLARIVES